MKYKIEKNVEIPNREKKSGANPKYPFEDMKVGDCFKIPNADNKTQKRVSSSAILWSKRRKNGKWKFATRQIDGVLHVWRLENVK